MAKTAELSPKKIDYGDLSENVCNPSNFAHSLPPKSKKVWASHRHVMEHPENINKSKWRWIFKGEKYVEGMFV